jgi:CheY-like chemotaxis protein
MARPRFLLVLTVGVALGFALSLTANVIAARAGSGGVRLPEHRAALPWQEARLLAEPDLEFAGSLHNLERVAEEAERLKASIVLVDIEIPGPDVFEVILDLARRCPSVRPIVLSAYVRDHYIDSALAAGAWGYLSKSDDPASIMEGIRKVAEHVAAAHGCRAEV